MQLDSRNLVRRIREAHLPEIFRDSDLEYLIGGTPARRHNLVKRALARGELIRIRRGLYALDEIYRKEKIHPFGLAQWILGLPISVSNPLYRIGN